MIGQNRSVRQHPLLVHEGRPQTPSCRNPNPRLGCSAPRGPKQGRIRSQCGPKRACHFPNQSINYFQVERVRPCRGAAFQAELAMCCAELCAQVRDLGNCANCFLLVLLSVAPHLDMIGVAQITQQVGHEGSAVQNAGGLACIHHRPE